MRNATRSCEGRMLDFREIFDEDFGGHEKFVFREDRLASLKFRRFPQP
jgi:hypothetical protein